MNYATIKKFDIANGPGVRVSLFVSGCCHHCKDCFNEVAWDFNYGNPFTKEVEEEIFSAIKDDYIEGLTLLGGEPFEVSNQIGLLPFIKEYKKRFPNKTLWFYSGFVWEELTGKIPSRAFCDITKELLSYGDVLVDGKFVAEEKDISLRFKGSRNQRILDIQKSLQEDAPVLKILDDVKLKMKK